MPETEIQRRIIAVTMSSVIPATMAMGSAFAASAVLAEEITGSATLATLAAGSMSLGSMTAAVPLSRRMARLGRRSGLVFGWRLGAAGAATAVMAAILNVYLLVVLGMIGVGVGQTTNLAARYAVADNAAEDRLARSIGLLVWASTFGAAAGPAIALGPVAGLAGFLGLPELAGPYLLSTAMFVTGSAVTHAWLRPDPLEVLGTIGEQAPKPTSPLVVIRRIAALPAARLALLAMLVGQLVMVGVMTATPLHMTSGDQDLAVIGQVISLHIVGMYAFSPIVGWLVDRLGTHIMVTAGGLVLFWGAEIAGHTDPEHSAGLFSGLMLIGIGWSCGLIAGSTLLTNAFPVESRVEVQGAADFVMISGGALGAMSSGALVESLGFQLLSHYSGIAALLLVAAAAGAWFSARVNRTRQLA
ncbi:MAG: MFS transporter [Acidimicrobiaceae bacterium]|nr:MFS transporter [Acidimicrobiaceae bacterium]MCY4281236.1 MFS transporter [Acidimicrobiaceae bacterium]MCY4294266.1 MFS transporter [Acidimicrobiaceae bacterium]